MPTTLLCLLSEQHVPNLLSVHHFKPDRLVLVESEAMRKRNVAAHFLNALKLGGLDYDARSDIEPLPAEDSLESVRGTLRQAYGRQPSAHWIANLTGGTKPMSIATYEFFKAVNGRLVYTPLARPAEMLDVGTQHTETCQHRLNIKEFLAGYGFASRKADDKTQEAEARAGRDWPCARVIAEHATSDDLLALADDERKKARDKGWQLQPGQLRSPAAEVTAAVSACFALTANDAGLLSGKLSKYAVEFLTGGWLEVFFWGLIATHAGALDVWDVQLGLEVGRAGASAGAAASNDFDVAFMRNYGLGMIECKSGTQSHDSGGDVLYKVEAVTRQFRALRVRSYLATTGTNVLDKEGQIRAAIANRAAIYDCRILTTDDIRELALHADSPDRVKATLLASDEKR
jgi:hypothetical protein